MGMLLKGFVVGRWGVVIVVISVVVMNRGRITAMMIMIFVWVGWLLLHGIEFLCGGRRRFGARGRGETGAAAPGHVIAGDASAAARHQHCIGTAIAAMKATVRLLRIHCF